MTIVLLAGLAIIIASVLAHLGYHNQEGKKFKSLQEKQENAEKMIEVEMNRAKFEERLKESHLIKNIHRQIGYRQYDLLPDVSVQEQLTALLNHLGLSVRRQPAEKIVVEKIKPIKKK